MKNKDKVFVKIKGLYTEDEAMEVINVGTYAIINGKEYVRYEEFYDGDTDKSLSTIKIDGNRVEVSKKGAITTQMSFELGQKTSTLYSTPYGNMNMVINTNELEIEREESTISIRLVYSMELNYEKLSDCEISIVITKEKLSISEE